MVYTIQPSAGRAGWKEASLSRQRFQHGCVLKRGKREKVWVGRYREDVLGPNMTVKRMRRTVILGPVAQVGSKREAQRVLERILQGVNSGQHCPRAVMTFAEFLDREWQPAILPTYRASTKKQYVFLLSRFILPRFGSWPLHQIHQQPVQALVTSLKDRVAPKTIRAIAAVLSAVLRTARDWGYLNSNPVRGVKLPPNRPQSEKRPLTVAEFHQLTRHLAEPARTIAFVAVVTGMRIGKILSLRWERIDFNGEVLHILESVYEGTFSSPKTKYSDRALPMGPTLKAILETWARQSRRFSGLVFPSANGGPFTSNNLLTRFLRPARKAAGLGPISWHHLRHTHTTWLKDAGVSPRVAQLQLGHSDVQTTLGIYTHVLPHEQRQAALAVERILVPNGPKSLPDVCKSGRYLQ